jgi:MinD-like ATPase involved in chromosome partitioning or flagellar assembly
MTFDRVLPELIRLCRTDATASSIQRYSVVRDVRGRVRLIVETRAKVDLGALEQALLNALGRYFVGPVLSNHDPGERARLAKALLDQSRDWPHGWPENQDDPLGGPPQPLDTRWTGIERTIGKEAWINTNQVEPPWRHLRGKTPPIFTFHSFKGGVGRTTLVAAYAVHLANATRKRVAVIDLDLEAPGLGALFGVDTNRGVLDVLVDHLATGTVDLTAASGKAAVGVPSVDEYVTVFPAGKIDDGYLQKLARLDFSSTEPGGDNPVGDALRSMLKKLRGDHDIVLLDSRAGLHDLAGMSLHGLAHVDVLAFRGTKQNLAGLKQTLSVVGTRDTEIVLVETMMPSGDEELFEKRRNQSRGGVYKMLCDHVYPDPLPQLDDKGETHDVVCIRRKESLDSLDALGAHQVDEMLGDAPLRDLAQRLDEKWLSDSEEEDE